MEEIQRLQRLLDDLKEIETRISNISGQSVTLKYEGISPQELVKQYGSVDKAVKAVTTDLRRANNELTSMTGSIGAVQSILRDVRAELGKVNDPLKKARSTFNRIEGIAQNLAYNQADIVNMSAKDVKIQRDKAQRQFNILKFQKEELKNKKDTAEQELSTLQQAYKNDPSEKNKRAVESKRSELNATRELLSIAEGKNTLEAETLKAFDEQARQIDNINSGLGISGELVKSLGSFAEKMGFQGFSDQATKIVDDMKDLSFELSKGGQEAVGFSGKMEVLTKGVKGLGSALFSALNDPTVLFPVLIGLMKKFVDIGMHASQAAVDIARSFGQTQNAGALAYKQIRQMSLELNSAFSNASDLVKANQELNAELGTSVVFSKEQLEIQSLLTNQLGLSSKEAANAAKFAAMQGKTGEQIVDSILAQGDGLINNRELVQEVLAVSADTAALYDNNPTLIAKAVMETKKLGMSLQQAKNIAGGLLDFESSIDAEMEAQLLTGRSMNLARARELALQGKTAEAAAEARRQIGGYTEFMKQGPLAQQAIAKSMNMSTDELAEQLRTTELIDQVRRENPGISQEQANTEALRRTLSASERLGQSMTTLKESFASIIEGPLATIVDFFSGIFQKIAESPFIKGLVGGAGVLAGVGTLAAGIFATSKLVARTVTDFRKGRPGETPTRPTYTKIVGGTGEGGLGDSVTDSIQSFMDGADDSGGGYTDAQGRYRDKKTGKFKKKPGQVKGPKGSKMKPPKLPKGGGMMARMGGMGGTLMSGLSMAAQAAPAAASMFGRNIEQQGADQGNRTKETIGSSLAQSGDVGVAKQGIGLLGGLGGFFSKLNPLEAVKKSIGKFAPKIFSAAPKMAKRIPLLGSVIEGIFARGDIKEMIASGLPAEEIYQDIGRRGLQAIGGILGGGGAALAIQAANIVPGLGVILTPLAGLAGDFIGRSLGGLLADASPSIAGSVGKGLSTLFSDNDKIESGGTEQQINKQKGQIPALATGGIVDKPTLSLIGEAGPEAVIPLDQLYKKFDELITVVKQGGNVYIDGDKAGRAIMMGSYKTA